MEVRPIGPLVSPLTSDKDLQKEINALESQMQGLEPGSPEYVYDQLHLNLEKEEQKIRAAHPNLDPLNSADAKKLDELSAQDPTIQDIEQQLRQMSKEFASEVSGWGIPWYISKVVLDS